MPTWSQEKLRSLKYVREYRKISQCECTVVSFGLSSIYRRKALTEELIKSLLLICFGITEKYEIEFIEIGTDEDHVHFLIQGTRE